MSGKGKTGLRTRNARLKKAAAPAIALPPPVVDPCVRYLCSGKGFHSPDCPKVALFRENKYMSRRPDDLITGAMRGFRAGERER